MQRIAVSAWLLGGECHEDHRQPRPPPGGAGPASVQAALLTTAQRTGVAALGCDNTSSDHWSFELAGLPAARVGSTPYAAYHSAADLPGVVRPAQLRRVGALMWDWLRS